MLTQRQVPETPEMIKKILGEYCFFQKSSVQMMVLVKHWIYMDLLLLQIFLINFFIDNYLHLKNVMLF